MSHLRQDQQLERDDAGVAVGDAGVTLERVVPAVSVGAVHAHDLDRDATEGTRGVELRRIVAAVRMPVLRNALVVVGLMAVVAVVVGDARVGVGGVSIIAVAVAVRFIDRHVTFSFGQGFVGFRGDMGWPQGVQEDDDVRWDWHARTAKRPAEHRG